MHGVTVPATAPVLPETSLYYWAQNGKTVESINNTLFLTMILPILFVMKMSSA